MSTYSPIHLRKAGTANVYCGNGQSIFDLIFDNPNHANEYTLDTLRASCEECLLEHHIELSNKKTA